MAGCAVCVCCETHAVMLSSGQRSNHGICGAQLRSCQPLPGDSSGAARAPQLSLCIFCVCAGRGVSAAAAEQPRSRRANAPPLGTMRMPSRARRTSARMSRGVVLAAGRRTPPASQMRSGLQKAGDLNPQRLYAAHSARGRRRSCEKRTLSATSPRRLLFCRLRHRAVRGGRWRTLRERSKRMRRAERPPAAAPTAVWPWRAAREPRRDSRRPSGTESASREARDVAGGTNRPQTGSPPPMALSMALGGLSLGAAPLNARSALGCTDGLRVRLQCKAGMPLRAPLTRAPRSLQAQAAPAVAAPLRTATTAEVRVRGVAPARLALGAACRCPAGAHAPPRPDSLHAPGPHQVAVLPPGRHGLAHAARRPAAGGEPHPF